MVAPIFEGWLNYNQAKSKNHGIDYNGAYMSWYEAAQAAKAVTDTLPDHPLFIVDPELGLNSIISLLAVAMKPGAGFIWAKINAIQSTLQPIAKGIYTGLYVPKDRQTERPYYGTLTSGSTQAPKIPVGFADHLSTIGIYYDNVLFDHSGAVASCLPMEYSATFMMALLPAWFSARNLILYSADKWHTLLARLNKEPITVVTVPSLLSAACAAAIHGCDSKELTFLATAGYLSKSRISKTLERFPNATLHASYGASETGIMTLDRSPQGLAHVGHKLYGKPLWLQDMNENGVGKVTTSGLDGREFYLTTNHSIRSQEGFISSTDLGHFDENGNLYLDGRIDQSEKLYGISVYPKHIEEHLLQLGSVLDVKVKVYSEKDKNAEYIEALVVGNVNEQELRAHCQSLSDVMRPKYFVIQAEEETKYSERGKL